MNVTDTVPFLPPRVSRCGTQWPPCGAERSLCACRRQFFSDAAGCPPVAGRARYALTRMDEELSIADVLDIGGWGGGGGDGVADGRAGLRCQITYRL